MNAMQASFDDWFRIENVRQKIAALKPLLQAISARLTVQNPVISENPLNPMVIEKPGRDVQVADLKLHPKKPGIATSAGQIRLLHDLASIELQAMELAVETLALVSALEIRDADFAQRFPHEDRVQFQTELVQIAREESEHLQLCLDRLDQLDARWGCLPVHTALWEQAPRSDFLLRLLVVHRHMEASGLDAGSRILEKLVGVKDCRVRDVVRKIVDDEVGHVGFGSRWYRRLAAHFGVDSENHFKTNMPAVLDRVKRTERLCVPLRSQAGFSDFELKFLSEVAAQAD